MANASRLPVAKSRRKTNTHAPSVTGESRSHAMLQGRSSKTWPTGTMRSRVFRSNLRRRSFYRKSSTTRRTSATTLRRTVTRSCPRGTRLRHNAFTCGRLRVPRFSSPMRPTSSAKNCTNGALSHRKPPLWWKYPRVLASLGQRSSTVYSCYMAWRTSKICQRTSRVRDLASNGSDRMPRWLLRLPITTSDWEAPVGRLRVVTQRVRACTTIHLTTSEAHHHNRRPPVYLLPAARMRTLRAAPGHHHRQLITDIHILGQILLAQCSGLKPWIWIRTPISIRASFCPADLNSREIIALPNLLTTASSEVRQMIAALSTTS